MKKRALLLAGKIDKNIGDVSHKLRFQNDIGLAYKLLSNLKFDVDVCYYKGREFEYESTIITPFSAERENLIKHMEKYAEQLSDEDILFVGITNHGGIDDGDDSYINLLEDDFIRLHDMKILLSKISCKKIVVMGQCYGGNMLRYDIPNSIIITAAGSDNVTHRLIRAKEKLSYDEFFYYFFSYLSGCYPNGTKIHKHKPRCTLFYLCKAYIYAKKHAIQDKNSQIKFLNKEFL